jgi:dolichyl-phosphate beta-glucosyltransferase
VTVAISVVMPAHNEADLLEQSVGDVLDGLRARGEPFEVLVVENGSADSTAAIARRLQDANDEVTVSSLPTADYGTALRSGLLDASGDVVVNFDVDYYDLAFLDEAVARLRGSDALAVVVGSKRAEGADDTRPFGRRAVTWGFAVILRLGFGLRVSDTHGMKAMVRAHVEDLARRCRFDGDLVDTELVIRTERAGRGVGEIPVRVEERRPTRTPVVRRVLRSIVGLVRLRLALWQERRAA